MTKGTIAAKIIGALDAAELEAFKASLLPMDGLTVLHRSMADALHTALLVRETEARAEEDAESDVCGACGGIFPIGGHACE